MIGTMQYLLPKENVLPEYLCYVVKYMHLEKYFTGATIPHIYFKDYKKEEFNLDTLDRQKEIVNILGRIECVISSRQQELQKLDELIKARFVEMFGDLANPECSWDKSKLIDVCTDKDKQLIEDRINRAKQSKKDAADTKESLLKKISELEKKELDLQSLIKENADLKEKLSARREEQQDAYVPKPLDLSE